MSIPTTTNLPVRDGFETELIERGDGRAVLYLHSEWGNDPPDLSGFRLLSPSHPGYGGSTGSEQLFDLTDLLYYYLDFLDAAELRGLPLIGHGLGGMFAAELAALQPDRFTRLALIAPLGLWNPDHPVADFFAATPADLATMLYHDPESPAARRTAEVPAPESAGYVELMIERAKSMATAAKYLWPIPNRGLARRLHRVRMPTLLVWGESDRLCPPAYAEDFRWIIPHAQVAIVPAAGHLPGTEQPAALAEILGRFLGG